jgi:signal transduction histidine kinase
MIRSDISQGLISDGDVRKHLATIFPDAIILNDQFKIVTVSESTSALMGYRSCELTGKELRTIIGDEVMQQVANELKQGIFSHLIATFHSKDGHLITGKFSGFYLGLICDINGLIALQVKMFDQVGVLSQQLEESRKELDEFVYRSTHDLRGPLATMRGLVNLIKLDEEKLPNDLKQIVNMLDAHAQILDDRLFQLNYLAETSCTEPGETTLDCEKLESTLRATIEETMTVNCIDFEFNASQRLFPAISSRPVISLLNHLLLYLVTLPKASESKMSYSVTQSRSGLQVQIYAEGFLSNYQVRQAIQRNDPVFTTLIAYSDLINFFAAMKNAQRIQARIHVDYIFEMRQQITITVPRTG